MAPPPNSRSGLPYQLAAEQGLATLALKQEVGKSLTGSVVHDDL